MHNIGLSEEEIELVVNSEYFDAAWYLEMYMDVAEMEMDPVSHFLWLGARLGRNPSPRFHTDSYLLQHPDVAETGCNPLLHYLQCGKEEGRHIDRVPQPVDLSNSAGILEFWSSFEGARTRFEDRKTVLLVAHIAGNDLFGSERSFIDISKALNDIGYNVISVVPRTVRNNYIDLICQNSVAVYGFKYGWWNLNAPHDEKAIATFSALIARERIDIVHVNTITLDAPSEAAARMGIPNIIHVREIPSADKDLCAVLGGDATSIVTAVKARADMLITNSNATAAEFGQTDFPASGVVYNLVDSADLAFVPEIPLISPLRIGLISSNLPKKGVNQFLELACMAKKRSENLKFFLIGPLRPEIEALAEAIRSKEVDSNLVIAGYRDTPAEALQDLDVVMSLSTFAESFGRTVVEGMAAGRVVIANDKGAPPELIDHGKTGFIIPFGDLDKALEYLLKLEADRTLLSTMGKAAKQHAISNFGPVTFCESLAEAYGRLTMQQPKKMILPARESRQTRSRDKLHVAYFCWHFPVPSETFVINELRILYEQGINVRVFCRQSPFPDFQPDFPIEWERVDSPETLARRLLETGRDIVHAHFVYPTVTEMVWPACRIANLPFTCIAHAQDIFRYQNAASNRIDEFAADPLCLQVFTLSSFHRDYLISHGVPTEKITINPNCVDSSRFDGASNVHRCSAPTKKVLAVSRFVEKKGLEVLIRSGKLLAEDDIQINIYGYGPLEEAYKKLINQENIKNVSLCGPVEGLKELIALHESHDLFIAPSVRAANGDMDGIPTTLIEAMASGMPVLSTPIAGVPDLIIDEVTGLIVDEATPEKLAARIRDFYALPSEGVEAMIQDAKLHLKRNFDGPRLVDTLLRFWCGETIDLVLVTWNNLEQTREVLHRLYEFTERPFHLSICDNGSDPDALAHLLSVYAKRDNFTLILNRENAKVGPGTNIAVAECHSDYAIYVCGKEGMAVRPGWERTFIDYLDSNPDVGQAGTLCYSPSYFYGRDYQTNLELFPQFRSRDFAVNNPDRAFMHIQGGLFAIRREAFDAIGGFSNAVAHSYTDVEFSYAMEAAGWRLGQVDGALSLFNKTRPGLAARVDETHQAIHPPSLSDLGWIDMVANGSLKHCNICEQSVASFRGTLDEQLCPHCSSDRRARSIHRVLTETPFLFRRLPAIGLGMPKSIRSFWTAQFQGLLLDWPEFLNTLQNSGRYPNTAGNMELAWLNDFDCTESDIRLALTEITRLLKKNSVIYISGRIMTDEIVNNLDMSGFKFSGRTRPSSKVRAFDWNPILKFTREDSFNMN